MNMTRKDYERHAMENVRRASNSVNELFHQTPLSHPTSKHVMHAQVALMEALMHLKEMHDAVEDLVEFDPYSSD